MTIFGMGAGIVIFSLVQTALYFNWMELAPVVYRAGAIYFTASGLASSCLRTLTLFCTKNLLTILFLPSCLTVVNSRMRTDKMNEATALVLVASQQITQSQHLR